MTGLVKASAAEDKAVNAIIAASNDRELLDAAGDVDFLPYKFEFEILVEAVECRASKNYDNQGIFFSFVVRESNSPNIEVNQTYKIGWFDKHPTMPEFVIAKQLLSRREFAAAVEGKRATRDYDPTAVLLKMHREVEPLGFKMRIRNVFERTTRKGSDIHAYQFERVS